MKNTSAYRRGETLLLHSNSQTTAGVWIAAPPFTTIDVSQGPSATGNVLIESLNASHSPVAHPSEWKGVLEPLLKLAGVASWAQFMKSTVCVNVQLDEGRLTLSPTRNEGTKGGFTFFSGSDIVLSANAPPDELGAALARAFALCEPAR